MINEILPRVNNETRNLGLPPQAHFPYTIHAPFWTPLSLRGRIGKPKKVRFLLERQCHMPTSKLQKRIGDMVRARFPLLTIQENIRPDWFTTPGGQRLELDLYVAELSIAFEVQGQQHYQFTALFHKSQADFEAQLKRDDDKRALCDSLGIALYAIDDENDLEVALRSIEYGERLDKTLRDRQFTPDPLKVSYILNATKGRRDAIYNARQMVRRALRHLDDDYQRGKRLDSYWTRQFKKSVHTIKTEEIRLLKATAKVAQYYDNWIAPRVNAGDEVWHKGSMKKAVRRSKAAPDLREETPHRWIFQGKTNHWAYIVAQDPELGDTWLTECGSFKVQSLTPPADAKSEMAYCKNCSHAYMNLFDEMPQEQGKR